MIDSSVSATDERAMVISCDGHVALPLAEYRPYVEQRFQADFDALIANQEKVSLDFAQSVDRAIYDEYATEFIQTGIIDGLWDVDRRVKELAGQGVVGEILFPDAAPFGSGGIGANHVIYRGELELAGARAYNRWLVEFTSAHPSRFAGQALMCLWDIDEAVKDVYWAANNGLKGLVMPGTEGSYRPLWDPAFNPFWAACEDTGLPLNFHAGVGAQPDYGPEIEGVPFPVRLRVQFSEFAWYAHRPLWWLIWSGVLERHPGLRLVFTEQHSEWIPGILARLDHSYAHSQFDDAIKSIVKHKPSEYWARQCFTGASLLSRHDLEQRDQIGIDRMLFGADFPHPEGTCMNTLEYLQATLGDVGVEESEARRFLGLNAAHLFGFDVEALQPLVNNVGPLLSEVLTPLPAELRPKFDRTDVVRP